ncbi:MAG: DUF4173 domain-containing protein [Pedobacter sp.]|nr:MAG: DUF4173 domain-containing protein [Pedobacter sp.]
MKKPLDLQLLAIFGGGLLFNFLFWNEGLGVNLLLYSLFVIGIIFSKSTNLANKKTILIGSSHLLAAAFVVYNHAVLNIFTYYISLVVFVGFTYATFIRSIFAAFLSGFLQLLSAPINLIKKILNAKIGNFSLKPILRPIKYIVIPIFVLMVFSLVYSIANPVFANYLERFATSIGNIVSNVFTFFFGDLSVARFLHVIIGILFTAGILLAFKENSIEKLEANADENLVRKRKNRLMPTFFDEVKSIFVGFAIKKKMALKTENIIGIISFIALNLLLLFLNIIDVSTLWMGSMVGKNYSAELHEGTNALIFSIFMAMAVILYFFNGNLNFFSKNKTIKILVFLWIAQNAFLVCSVMLRDYHYIAMHGLTYKRIGVMVFLLLCTVGLATVYIKVAKKKTFFYLYKVNGLIWYILLIVFGFINWDLCIVNYNISHRKSIQLDLEHLLEMSDKTLPLLAKNRKMLEKYIPESYAIYEATETAVSIDTPHTTMDTAKTNIAAVTTTPAIDTITLARQKEQKRIDAFNTDLNFRISRFREEQQKLSWLSWNYRDWQTNQFFSN